MPKNKKTTKKKQNKIGLLRILPSVLVLGLAGYFSITPTLGQSDFGRDVLAYATNTTRSGLLASTNTQRSNNGAASLSLNSKLNSAAQSKAADMVNRGYWSHETPDGQQPWIFFTAAGYNYLAAGENLAYGYPDSNQTVIGWMNSPPHKSNLISGNYSEVGFGIANTPDYCYVGDHDNNPNTPATNDCKGPQTIVVAMYGKPQVASATSTAPTKPAPATQPSTPVETKPKPVAKIDKSKDIKEDTPEEEPIAINTESKIEDISLTAAPSNTSKIQLLTNGNAAWSATALIMAICSVGLLWAIHKGIHVKKYVVAGEHFLAKHVYLDVFVISLVVLGFVLLSSTGSIR